MSLSQLRLKWTCVSVLRGSNWVLIHGLSDLWFCLFLLILLIMSCWFCVLNMIQWATKLCVEVVEFFYYMSLFIYVSWVFYLLNIFTTYLYFFMWGCWIFLLSCWFCVSLLYYCLIFKLRINAFWVNHSLPFEI